MTDTSTTVATGRIPVRLAIGLPAGWMRLPRFADDASSDEAIAAWATSVATATHATPVPRVRLGIALATLARAQRHGGRAASAAATLVSIGDPATTSVCAVGFVEVVARPAAVRSLHPQAAADACRVDLEDAARFAPTGPGMAVRRRAVDMVELDGDPAIAIDELLVVRDARGTRTLQRRYVLIRFPDAPGVLQLTITSPRLRLDPPLEATARAIASSIRMETAS